MLWHEKRAGKAALAQTVQWRDVYSRSNLCRSGSSDSPRDRHVHRFFLWWRSCRSSLRPTTGASYCLLSYRPAGTAALSRRITDSLNTQSRKVILCLRHQQLHHQAQTHFTSSQWDMSSIVNSVIYGGDFCSAFPPTSFKPPFILLRYGQYAHIVMARGMHKIVVQN